MTSIKLNLPSIKLQTDYRSESYVSASGSLSAIARGTDYDVFSVSTSGAVVDVSVEQLYNTNFPGKATFATSVLNPSNQKVISFATDGANLYYIDESQKYPSWNQITTHFDGIDEVVQNIQTSYQNGNLFVSVHTKESGSAGAWRFYTVTGVMENAPQWTTERIINALTNYQSVYDWVFGATVNTKNGPLVGYLISGPEPSPTEPGKWLDGVYLAQSGGQVVVKIATGTYSSISTYWDVTNKMSYTFGVSGTDQLLYYFQTGASAPVKVDTTDQLSEVVVVPSANINPQQNILNVFAATKTQRLVHTWTVLNGSTSLTFDRQSYPATQVVNFVAITDTLNIAKVFAVTSSNNLKLIFKDPHSTDWITETIEVPTPSNVDQFKSYYLSATVLDDQDRPQSFKNFKLYSDIAAEIEANGALYQVEEGSYYQNVTNALGRVDLVLRTDTVASPIFSLWVEGMDPATTIAVDPSGDINNQFKNMTAQQLLAAQSQTTGQPLLQGEYHTQEAAEQVSKAITSVMGLANSVAFAGLKAAPKHIGKGSPKQVTEHIRKTFDKTTNPNRIHVASAPKAHFKIDFTGKYPVCTNLTDNQVQNHFSEARAKIPQQRAALAHKQHLLAGKPLLGGFFDWDWGDVWGMIEDGVGELVSVVVQVGETIAAQVTMVIDGVTQFFETVIEYVQQAFDVVESIFEKVKVFFEELWQWLCFLFDWSDIQNTQTVIKYYINSSVDYIHDLVVNDGTLVTQQVFSTIKDNVNSLFDSAITSVTGVNVNSGGQGSNPLLTSNAGNLQDGILPDLPSAADWFLNKVLNFFSDDSWNIPDLGLGNLLQSFIDAAQNCGAIDQVKNALNALQDFFSGNWTSEGSVWGAALVTILNVAKSLVLAVLDAIETLVSIFLQLVGGGIMFLRNILNGDIDIPVVSWIFKHVFGFSMSILDVFSLIIALPATIAYKIAKGQAPFTDQQVRTITSGPFVGPPLPATSSESLRAIPQHKSPILAALGDPSLQQTLLVLAGWAQIINVPFDMAQDIPGGIAEYAKIIKAGAVLIPTAIQMLRVPLWIFSQSWDEQPNYVKWQIGGWITGWVAPVSTVICFIATKGEKGLRGFSAGRVFLCLIGAVQLGVNITTGVLMEQNSKANHHTWINQIVGPVNNLAKPLAISKNPYALAALQLIDLVTNLTVGINTIVQGQNTLQVVFHQDASLVKEDTKFQVQQHTQQVQKLKHA